MLVKYNEHRVLCFQEKKIIPGINDLTEDFVSDMMSDSILAHKFDKGLLELLDKEDLGIKKLKVKKGVEPSAVDLLLATPDHQAKKLVDKTVDVAILEDWIAKEKRSVIKKALKAQLTKIGNIEYRQEKKSKLEKAPPSDESDEE